MLGSGACGTSAGFTSCAAKTTFDSGYKVPRISWAKFEGGGAAAGGVGDWASITDADMALPMSSANTALLIPMFSPLVPDLGTDVLGLVDFAVGPFRNQPRIGEVADRQNSRGHHPRLRQRLGIVHSDFVQNLIALTREFLDDVHRIGMEETAAREPRAVDERNGVEHQRIAFPVAHGVSIIRGLDGLLLVVLAAIRRDDTEFIISSAAIGVLAVEENDVVTRLDDAPGRALARIPQRLAGHHRVVLVRPHVELLDFVPELRFVQWATRTEPRGRFELKVHGLIECARAPFLLRGVAAAIPVAPIHAGRVPVAREVRVSIGKPRRVAGSCQNRWGHRGWLRIWSRMDRRLDAARYRHHHVNAARLGLDGGQVANHSAVVALGDLARV